MFLFIQDGGSTSHSILNVLTRVVLVFFSLVAFQLIQLRMMIMLLMMK